MQEKKDGKNNEHHEMKLALESFINFFDSLKERAEAAIKTRLYSPQQDEIELAKIQSKLAKSEEGISELLMNMMEVGMRLHLFFSKRGDILKAERLSRSMAIFMRNTLVRARRKKLKLTDSEESRVESIAEYWESVHTIDSSIKSNTQEDVLEQSIESKTRDKKYDEAVEDLKELLKLEEKTEDTARTVATLRKIAEVMRKKGDLEKTLEYYQMAANIDPVAWFDVGLTFGEMRHYQESVKAYNKFLKKVPESASAWHNKGWAYQNLNRFSIALRCYEKALTFNKSFLPSLIGKGWILMRQGRIEEAINAYEEALNVDPKNQDALIALTGLYNDDLCDYKKAVFYANKALEADPDNIPARTNLAEALVLVGRYKEARNHAKKILQLVEEPSHKLAMHFTIASSYFLEGKAKEATESLEDLMDYRVSLPPRFVNNWRYDGILNLITKSSIQEEHKTKLFETIKACMHACEPADGRLPTTSVAT